MDVYIILCRLADVGHLEGVTGILKGPLTACPELVLLGLASAAPSLDRRTLQARLGPAPGPALRLPGSPGLPRCPDPHAQAA